jgi:hypothetical protein
MFEICRDIKIEHMFLVECYLISVIEELVQNYLHIWCKCEPSLDL